MLTVSIITNQSEIFFFLLNRISGVSNLSQFIVRRECNDISITREFQSAYTEESLVSETKVAPYRAI